MHPRIHPSAIVHPESHLDPTVEVAPYAIIGPKVRIGAGTRVGAHTVIDGDTTIGERNNIFHMASIGAIPQDLKYAGEDTQLIIGDDNKIREFTTLHIGTSGGGGVTRIGNKNLFMAYSHVAHDCLVGDGCVFANGATLGGHVEVGDNAILGGLSGVHQFSRIGKHAFLAGGAMVTMDIPPYCTAQGDRAELVGLNTVGLRRHNYTDEQIRRIKDAYKIIFLSKLGLDEAISKLKAEYSSFSEIQTFLDFFETSKRGIMR
jgi:UDP-N-acetylglucosamine acyltransferase